MAAPETRTGQSEAAGLWSAVGQKSARRFITTVWLARRFKEVSWAGRFNLAILAIALLNAAAVLSAQAFDKPATVAIGTATYSIVVLVWMVGFSVQMFLVIKRFFTSSPTGPPADTGNNSGQDKPE